MDAFCATLIKDRRGCTVGDLEGRTDVLSRAMCMEDPERPGCFPYRDNDAALRDIILNFLIAGRDTTAQALSWCVLKVACHPGVEEGLAEEAARVMGGRSTTPTTTTPTYELVEKHLRYTRATVLETLRLCPSVPKDLKVAVERDVLPDGTVIPPGAQVAYLPHAMGRSVAIWGEDAERFDPERFVRTPNPSPWAFPVFNGAGPRACLGQRMALVEACYVLARIYGKYSLRLSPLEQGAPGGCPYQDSLTLPMKRGLLVTVAVRG
jgi:cytochrome P450